MAWNYSHLAGLALMATLLAEGPAALAQSDGETGQEGEARPAPEYFIQAIIATTTAQALAQACSTLSMNPAAFMTETNKVMAQLEADGFDTTKPYEGMADIAPELQRRQEAFLLRHGLEDTPSEETVCAAGEAEIADGSEIGAYLVIVGQE